MFLCTSLTNLAGMYTLPLNSVIKFYTLFSFLDSEQRIVASKVIKR